MKQEITPQAFGDKKARLKNASAFGHAQTVVSGYPAATIKSILLHVILFGMLYAGFVQSTPEPVKKVVPKYIQAVVIEKTVQIPTPVDKPKIKQKPQPKQVSKPEPKVKPKVPPKVIPKEQPKVAAKPKEQPKPEPKEEPKPKPKPVPTLDANLDDKTMNALLAEEKVELERVETAARAARAAEAEQLKLKDKYAVLMQQKVERYWSRPPSARNGMQVILSIKLFPGGDVREVSLVEGSGDSVFDRSAVLAVQKAGFFEVPSDSDVFQKYFSKLTLVFRPEDLRL